jgi:hypothetical protein
MNNGITCMHDWQGAKTTAAPCKVTALQHELRDNTVEDGLRQWWWWWWWYMSCQASTGPLQHPERLGSNGEMHLNFDSTNGQVRNTR